MKYSIRNIKHIYILLLVFIYIIISGLIVFSMYWNTKEIELHSQAYDKGKGRLIYNMIFNRFFVGNEVKMCHIYELAQKETLHQKDIEKFLDKMEVTKSQKQYLARLLLREHSLTMDIGPKWYLSRESIIKPRKNVSQLASINKFKISYRFLIYQAKNKKWRPNALETTVMKKFAQKEEHIIREKKSIQYIAPLPIMGDCYIANQISHIPDTNYLGAIAIEIPILEERDSFYLRKKQIVLLHVLLWILGVAAVTVFFYLLYKFTKKMHQARNAAEQANQAKSLFLTSMSHEIRTPMNGIIGMTDILTQTEMTIEQKDMVETIDQSSKTLLAIINDILDFSKIEVGRLDLESIPISLTRVIDNVQKILKQLAKSKGLDLSVWMSKEIPDFVSGDPVRLQQVLLNLVNNAIKFTDQGEVFLSVDAVNKSEHSVRLEFKVRDTGIGIAPDRLDSIFEPFVQADSSTTRKYGGSGLGLVISQQIVQKMGGQIFVKSEVGKGSVFYFSVDFSICKENKKLQDKKRAAVKLQGRKYHILLAEDNEVNQKITQKMLLSLGHTVDIVSNGVLAVEKSQENIYDLVLMDILMPEMDGYSAVKKIRTLEKTKHVAIVALTANAMREEKERALQSGFDGFLTKPFYTRDLQNAIDRTMERTNKQRLSF